MVKGPADKGSVDLFGPRTVSFGIATRMPVTPRQKGGPKPLLRAKDNLLVGSLPITQLTAKTNDLPLLDPAISEEKTKEMTLVAKDEKGKVICFTDRVGREQTLALAQKVLAVKGGETITKDIVLYRLTLSITIPRETTFQFIDVGSLGTMGEMMAEKRPKSPHSSKG